MPRRWMALVVMMCLSFVSNGFLVTNRRQQHSGGVILKETTSTTTEPSPDTENHIKASAVATETSSFLLRISFDGRHYTGWSAANDPAHSSGKSRRRQDWKHSPKDVQKPGFVRSVQGVLIQRLAQLYGNVDPARIVVEGCSRTDKGVHARGLVAQVYCLAAAEATSTATYNSTLENIEEQGRNPVTLTEDCITPCKIPLDQLTYRLNRMCPDDLRVVGYAHVPKSGKTAFHPTLSTRWKTYVYTLSTGLLADPTRQRQVWHVANHDWNATATAAAAAILEGTHDFAAFCPRPRGASDRAKQRNTTCTMSRIGLEEQSSQDWDHCVEWQVSVTGNRFLYKQVRRMVGAVVAVGQGRLSVSDIRQALTGAGSMPAFPTAPAHGLVLESVDYGNNTLVWHKATV